MIFPLDLSTEKLNPCRSRMLHFMGKVGLQGKKDVGGMIDMDSSDQSWIASNAGFTTSYKRRCSTAI